MLTDLFTVPELDRIYKDKFVMPREKVSLETLKNDGVVIFGAGLFGKGLADALLQNGVVVDWFVDSNEKLIGSITHDAEVKSISSLENCGSRYVVLTSGYAREMKAICNRYNIAKCLLTTNLDLGLITSDAMGYSEEEIEKNSALQEFADLLEDECSIDTLKAFIAWQITFKNSYFEAVKEDNIYFPSDIKIDSSRFVDAGAFTGDTFASWHKHASSKFGIEKLHYYGFEPGPQFAQLQRTVSTTLYSCGNLCSQHIKLYQKALGERPGTCNMQRELCLRMSGHKDVKSYTVEVDTLDNILADDSVSYLKLDVEGLERKVLSGAVNLLKKSRPAVAISVYHMKDDLYLLPLWLHKKKLNYKFFLRHYANTFSDTVCYAIPL